MEDILGIIMFIVLIAIGFIAAAIAFVALLLLCMWPIASHGCSIYGGNTNHQVKYVAYTGDCYVKTPQGWFTKDQINQASVSH